MGDKEISKNEKFEFITVGIIFIVTIAIVLLFKLIDTSQAIQITISFILVLITYIYVKRTAEIAQATKTQAEATKQQSEASVKMAEEMRVQRIMASRPVIIQKAILETETKLRTYGSQDWFSYFEIYNAGNGPAIELEISLLDRLDIEKTSLHSQRKTYLQAGETITFKPFSVASLDVTKTYYLACEYQGILSHSTKTWYQSLLPFTPVKSSQEGKIYIIAGELEFNEVFDKERIDAFSSRSKPK